MKKYYKDFYGCTASTELRENGQVRLIICTGNGSEIYDKELKNEASCKSNEQIFK